MALTEEERFRFDLTGFLVRPSILDAGEVAAIAEHVGRVLHNLDSLAPEHRAIPAGPAELLIDHPRVIDVVHELIGPEVRLDNSFGVWRHQSEDGGQDLHQGGRLQADPIFGYRVQEGRIFAGIVRVVFELTDVDEKDGATQFLIGSHKANFPVTAEHMPLDGPNRSPFLTSYSCPAGSAVFFTENVLHAGAPWRRATPRVAVLNAYNHVVSRWHRPNIPPAVLAALPLERRAYFREPWGYDFTTRPATPNSEENFRRHPSGAPSRGFVDADG